MRNYIHIIRNLPGILKRIEDELRGKASASSVSALCADMNSLNRRLADRPTKADLTIFEGDLGARIEKLEALVLNTGPTGEDLRSKLVGMLAEAKSNALNLTVEPTGGPNLFDVLAKVKAEKIAGEVKNGKITPNAARKALRLVPTTTGDVTFGNIIEETVVDGQIHREIAGQTITITKPKKPRKPRTPKGGGK